MSQNGGFIQRKLTKGLGEAVAKRTILRDGESWDDVAKRVAFGNVSLVSDKPEETQEYANMYKHITNGSLLMSGRHLQHGDKTQKSRNQEVFTNCSVTSFTFVKFYLLLNGSGVGRSYDDDICVVNWDNMPEVRCVLSQSHKDFVWGQIESSEEGKSKYGNAVWHVVEDSREGWAKAVELLETSAFNKDKDKMIVLDFSLVRENGSPIGGMQNRPASGPIPLMKAIEKIKTIRGCGMKPWKQSMFVDHFLAECVLVGGVRRSARLASKFWSDPEIEDFIDIKKNGGLWSANNSIAVDSEFWKLDTDQKKSIYMKALKGGYDHNTGEPGFINVDKLVVNNEGLSEQTKGNFIGNQKFQVSKDSKKLFAHVAKQVMQKKYKTSVNPCQGSYVRFLTKEGNKMLKDINVGDIIWSGDRWTKLTAKWSTGIKPVFRYTMSNGAQLDMTENHRVVENGIKVEMKDAETVDRVINYPSEFGGNTHEMPVIAGLVLGDGTKNEKEGRSAYLIVGENDGDVFKFVEDKCHIKVNKGEGNIKYLKLPFDYDKLNLPYNICKNKYIPNFWKETSSETMRLFLRGLYSANGSVVASGGRITYKTISRQLAEDIMEMMSTLGFRMYITTNQTKDVQFENGLYTCAESYDINTVQVKKFLDEIGFIQQYKNDKININKKDGRPLPVYVRKSELIGELPVFDYTVEADEHTVAHKGFRLSNCSEVVISLLSGFCVIADVVPYFAPTIDDAEEAFRIATRALIRVNTMDSIFNEEVKRTNRIGVGLTGVHEFAWDKFGYGFKDLIDEEKSKDFWLTMSRFKRAVREEAIKYSKELGVSTPHTDTTVKPSGSVSKLFSLSEGVHLPAMKEYLRWVQFRNDDPLVKKYQDLGYPTRVLKTYAGSTIVGFPTQPEICRIGMGDKLITAGEATPEEQYKWLMLLEKYWIVGVDEQGNALPDTGNQISYTLKIIKENVSFEQYDEMVRLYQPKVKCCSVMPQTKDVAYEYQPEEPISRGKFLHLVENINDDELKEEIDFESLKCASGACPI